MTTNKSTGPHYMVAVESFNGMERQYFNSLNCAMTEYNRLVAHGRNAYFYNLTGM